MNHPPGQVTRIILETIIALDSLEGTISKFVMSLKKDAFYSKQKIA